MDIYYQGDDFSDAGLTHALFIRGVAGLQLLSRLFIGFDMLADGFPVESRLPMDPPDAHAALMIIDDSELRLLVDHFPFPPHLLSDMAIISVFGKVVHFSMYISTLARTQCET